MSQYSEKLIDHFSNPRNVGEMDGATATATVKSPVCGDHLQLFVKVVDERINETSYVAYGCAGSLATGSVLTEAILGRRIEELTSLSEEDIVALLGGLTPEQRHCATMAWDALAALVANYRDPTREHGATPDSDYPCET